MTVRAKFRCTGIGTGIGLAYGAYRYTFTPQYEPDVPEDQKFAKHTPQGELWMLVDNPAVKFTLGQDYYLDLQAVPAPASTAAVESIEG